MYQFGKLSIQNVVYFQEAAFDLNYEGITAIRGINKNSSFKRNNGSGKTLLFSCIPNAFGYNDPVTDSKAAKSIFRKNTFIDIS